MLAESLTKPSHGFLHPRRYNVEIYLRTGVRGEFRSSTQTWRPLLILLQKNEDQMQFPTTVANLGPLLLNKGTGEPYLQLPLPHENVRITPPRPGDVASTVEHLNVPQIIEWLAAPPFPYMHADGLQWNGIQIGQSQALFHSIEDGDRWADGCPVQSIRETQEDGTDKLIGGITIRRALPEMPWVASEDGNNLAKAVGDPTIVWTIGFYLATSHHRRGIMTAALRTLINAWAVPHMNCRRIIATAMVGNMSSVGVFKKVDFKHVRDIEDGIRLPEGRGGHWKSLHVMEWTYSGN